MNEDITRIYLDSSGANLLSKITSILVICHIFWLVALWRLKYIKEVNPPKWLVGSAIFMLGITVQTGYLARYQSTISDLVQIALITSISVILLIFTLWLEWKAWHKQKDSGRRPSRW